MPETRFALLLLVVLVTAAATVALAAAVAPALPVWVTAFAPVLALAACLLVPRR